MKLLDINKTYPGAIFTYSGVIFDVFNPKIENIFIIDIAHALSNLCRWGGHCPKYFSVAQHAVLCSEQDGTPEEQMEFLCHDNSEAYLVDIPRPIKRKMLQYVETEDKLQSIIASALGLPYPFSERVHEVDDILLNFEYKNFFEEPNVDFEFWTPEVARQKFLDRYEFLRKEILLNKEIIFNKEIKSAFIDGKNY